MPTSIKIAIADDHPIVRAGMTEVIHEHTDCTVLTTAANGRELVDNIRQLEELPDVCLIDINMPVMNGYDTVVALRDLYSGMKFLILSNHTDPYCITSMIRFGANGYLQKGACVDDIYNAITDIHYNGYHYSSIAPEKIFEAARSHNCMVLTDKERHFLSLVCGDKSYNEIAKHLGLSVRTVEDYQKRIGEKLDIHTRTGLAVFAVNIGLSPANI